LESYTQAIELDPDYLEATIKIGVARLQEGDYAEAAQAFDRAIELNDRIVSAYTGLGVAQQALGQTEEAMASLEMAAQIEPNGTLLFSELARLQLRVSAAENMNKYLSPQAIGASPAGPSDQEVSGFVQRQIAKLQAALRQHPDHADWHYRLGLLLKSEGELSGAIDAFRHAVAINPHYLKALTKLALALREAGQLDGAIRTLKRAVEVDPQSIDLHYQLGLMFADKNEFSLALDRFECAVSQEPHNLDYLANVALALQEMGLVDRATAGWRTLCQVAQATSEASAVVTLRTDSSDPHSARSEGVLLPRGAVPSVLLRPCAAAKACSSGIRGGNWPSETLIGLVPTVRSVYNTRLSAHSAPCAFRHPDNRLSSSCRRRERC
jgi:tetratricopeptide (TPR) repeat protein